MLSKTLVENIAKKVIARETEAINSLLKTAQLPQFLDFINAIQNCKGKVVFTAVGKSGHIARKAAATLSSVGIPAFFIHPTEAAHGDMGAVCSGDFVIMASNSGASTEITEICNYVKNSNIQSALICRKKGSFFGKFVNIEIVLEAVPECNDVLPVPNTSAIQLCSFFDIVAMILIDLAGTKSEDYGRYHPNGNIGMGLKTIEEVMRTGKDVPTVNISATMGEAIIEITEKKMGMTGVLSHGSLVGIVTDGDLRRNLQRENLLSLSVAEVMTKNPKFVYPTDNAAATKKMMHNKKITSVFVLESEGGKVCGAIHIHDIY